MKIYFRKIIHIIEEVGEFTVFSLKSFRYLCTPPFRGKILLFQLVQIGVASVGIISLSNIVMSMIFTIQMGTELNKFMAQDLTLNVLAQSLARETAPVITALMLIAKNGSAFSAEIGNMKITEQLDALKTMNVNPIHYIVAPRLLSCMIMFPFLTALANLAGLLAGMITMYGLLDLNYAFAIQLMLRNLTPTDILVGLGKSFFMGIFVCLICCFEGFQSRGGSQGVGLYTTRAVVKSSIAILIIDLLIGQLSLITNIVN